MSNAPKSKDYKARAEKVAENLFTHDDLLREVEEQRRPNDSAPYDFASIEKAFTENLNDDINRFFRAMEDTCDDDTSRTADNNQSLLSS